MVALRKWLSTSMGGREPELCQLVFFGILQGLGWSMVVPMMPLFARALGATDFQIGTVAIVPAVITIVFSIPGNALSLKYGRRAAFGWSFVLGCVSAALFFSARNLWIFAAAQLMFGLANTLFWPAQFASLTEVVPLRSRTRLLGYSMAISNFGTVFGSVIAGVLVDHLGFSACFVVYFAVSVVSLLLVQRMHPGERDLTISLMSALWKGMAGIGTILPRPVMAVTTLNTLVLSVNQGISDYFVPVFLKEVGYSATFIGTGATLRTAGLVTVRFGLEPLVKRIGIFPLLFLGVGTATVLMGAIPLLPYAPYILAASFVAGAGFGMAPVLTSALIAEATESRERGLGMALDQTSSNIGRVTSGLAFGAFAQVQGLARTVVVGNGLVLACLMGIVTLCRSLNATRMRGHAA